MTISAVRALRPGDQVKWNDPDLGLCSRIITIASIEICNEDENADEDDAVIKISGTDGGYVEAFAHELDELWV